MQPGITAAEADAYLRGYSDAQRGQMIDLEFLRRLPPNVISVEANRQIFDNVIQDKPRKRKTRYQAAYKRNFNKIKSNYVKKNGQWKQGGFKRAVREAHKLTRKQVS